MKLKSLNDNELYLVSGGGPSNYNPLAPSPSAQLMAQLGDWMKKNGTYDWNWGWSAPSITPSIIVNDEGNMEMSWGLIIGEITWTSNK